MRKRNEQSLLIFLLLFGLISLVNLVRKPPVKDWIIIFLLKGFLSSILDNVMVKKGYVRYPVKLFKIFDTSFIFDYLLFPITCVYYNQLTYQNGLNSIIKRVFYFSIPMTIVEQWLENKTNLIKYKNGWNWLYTLLSLSGTFLFVRAMIGLIRMKTEKEG
ncbi:CBO0543 family protein [Bacillus salacetis]|uniref:CBO0543 family protein n=1 Tax=Bacillus salacetis TaxID=2315464 RepID=UPI003B9E76F4